MRAAIYARFSTDLQSEASITDQVRVCQRYADGIGALPLRAIYSDEGISGGTADRPGYQAMLEAARRGDFDVIIAEDISRLWRNRAEYGSRSAELEDSGIHLVTCVGDDTRRDGWMVVTIKLAIAESQRREISYRTKRGLEGLALAGKSTGGKVYGYASAKEAAQVRRIFEARAQGQGYNEIARLLNREGVPGPRGPSWSPSTVMRLLANPRYKGVTVWGRTETRGGARDSRLKRHVERPGGPLVQRGTPELQLIPNALWEAANA